MCSSLLSESVNLLLDDFETSLCLPILVIMVLCTAQFVFNHVFDIGYIIYQNVKKPTGEEEEQDEKTADMMGKLKGMLTTLGIGKPGTTNTTLMKNPPSSAIDTRSRKEEWDYCDEDCVE